MLYLCKKEIALFMAKRKLPKLKEEKKPRSKSKYKQTQMDMALLEYVRCNFSTWEAEKVTEVHHTAIQRAWDALSEEERDSYRERAKTICDLVEENITHREVAVVSEVTEKLREIGDLALDEIRARLKDELRRMEIKDADLINIATKCIAIVDDNTRLKLEEKPDQNTSITKIYNIFENSIQENLQINSVKYEDK